MASAAAAADAVFADDDDMTNVYLNGNRIFLYMQLFSWHYIT